MSALKSALRATMRVAFVGALLLAAVSAPAAENKTTEFEVYLDVGNVCTLTKGGDVDFGRVVATGSSQDLVANGSLVVRCTLPTAYTITLDAGLHGTGISTRMMADSAGRKIGYRLFSGTNGLCGDWGGAQWGDGSAGTCVYSFTNHAADQTIQVKGRLTLTSAAAGAYSDTVTATITY